MLCSNYRGISLLSVSGKVFGHILLERMRDRIDKKKASEKEEVVWIRFSVSEH